MWKCPKCGREFAKNNQDHFCINPPTTIDEYIEQQAENVQPLLNLVRDTIRAAIPDAEEKISWRMPTFWKKHNVIHFAAFKKHLGLYPGDKAVEFFAERLEGLRFSKGAIQMPYDKPLPLALIAEIAKWSYEVNGR